MFTRTVTAPHRQMAAAIAIFALFLALPAVAAVDLQVQSLTVDPTSVTAGNTTAATFVVRNDGTTAAGAFSIGVYYSADNNITTADTLLDTVSLRGLANSTSSKSWTLDVTIPTNAQGGTRYIGVIVDNGGSVIETDESDNARSAVISVIGRPDLFFEALSVNPTSVMRGSETGISFRVRNNGFAPATFKSRVYYSDDGVITTADTYLNVEMNTSLAAGATSATLSGTVMIPSSALPGSRFVGVIADFANQVPEGSETNNVSSAAITVIVPACYGTPGTDPAVCGGHGTCIGTDVCLCEHGYDGAQCEPVCTGNCLACIGPETCDGCVDGWTGWSCSEAVCATPCGTNAECTDPDVCECVPGYSGDGFDCQPIVDCTALADWDACHLGACFGGVCEKLGTNDRCADAVELTEGNEVIGDLDGFHAFEEIPSGCIGEKLNGSDAFYKFETESAIKYAIEAVPHSSLDLAVVVWEDCTLSDKYCIDGINGGGAGAVESIELPSGPSRQIVIQIIGLNVSTATSASYSLAIRDVSESQEDSSTPHEDAVVGTDAADAAISDAVTADLPADSAITDVPRDTTTADERTGGSGGGCGQSAAPAPFAAIILLASLFVMFRKRRT